MSPSRRDAGYTIIEAMIVLVLVSIILTIGFTVLTRTSDRHDDTIAATNLNQVVVTQTQHAMREGAYTTGGLNLPDGLRLVRGASTATTDISVAIGANGTLGLAIYSPKVDRCHARQLSALTAQQPSVRAVQIPSGATCTGASALPSGEPPRS